MFVLRDQPFLTRIVLTPWDAFKRMPILMILVCEQKLVSRSRDSLFPVDVQLWFFFKDDRGMIFSRDPSSWNSETFHVSSNEQCKSSQQQVIYVHLPFLNVTWSIQTKSFLCASPEIRCQKVDIVADSGWCPFMKNFTGFNSTKENFYHYFCVPKL